MISEKEFSSDFSGFWAEILPFLTPKTVNEFNLMTTRLIGAEGWIKPLSEKESYSDNDVVSEIAFALFAQSLKEKKQIDQLISDTTTVDKLRNDAVRRILRLRSEREEDFQGIGKLGNSEGVELAKRMEDYFSFKFPKKEIIIQPRFSGCGMLNSCFGDILVDKCLFEIKMVERNLRSIDLRQVLTYCALNYQSQQYQIKNVALFNPRRGVELKFSLEELAFRVSRRTSSDLFHQIIDFVSSSEVADQTA